MLTPLLTFIFTQVVLSEVVKSADKTDCWAATIGDIFKNPYALATSGQQHFTGLTDDGELQYNEYLADVKAARADPVKRKFEKDHLAHYKAQNNIQCATYEEETARRNMANPTAGIAQDTAEELAWSDRELYGDESEDDESD